MSTPWAPPTVDEAVAFHGHMCAGLALGYRAAVEAMRALEAHRSEDEELVAIVENDSCAVDAIQLVSGCTFGKGNLIFLDHGKRVYTFHSRAKGRGVRVRTHYAGMGEDAEMAALRERIEAGDDSEATRQALDARYQLHLAAILMGPLGAVLTIGDAGDPPPPMARVEPSEPCAACGEAVQASRLVLAGERRLCRPCAAGAGV
jgi:formylmethanofuran dehydrogenase subunit E